MTEASEGSENGGSDGRLQRGMSQLTTHHPQWRRKKQSFRRKKKRS